MKNRFFSFLLPVLNLIDNGKLFREPLRWLYFFLASLNLLMPLGLIILAAGSPETIFSGFFFILGFVLFFLAVCFTSWVGFQIWWNRADTLRLFSSEGDENFATVAFSHFLQTSGEWLGATVALNGFFLGVLVLLGGLILRLINGEGLPQDSPDMLFFLAVRFGFYPGGILMYFLVILAPLAGYLILVTTRFLAEQLRALAATANYSRKILKIQLRRIRLLEKNHWD